MDLNLDTLKREIVDYLDSAGFAVFHNRPGGLEGLPLVLWDTENHPDYQAFLEVAQKCGTKLILFACAEFEASDIEELEAQLDDCDLSREERHDYESRLRDLRVFIGLDLLAGAGLRSQLAPLRVRTTAGLVRRIWRHRRRNHGPDSRRRRARFASRLLFEELTPRVFDGTPIQARGRTDDRFLSSVGMGRRPAKFHEKPW